MIVAEQPKNPLKFSEIEASALEEIFPYVSGLMDGVEGHFSVLQIGAGPGPTSGDFAGKLLKKHSSWWGVLVEPSLDNYIKCLEAFRGRSNVTVLHAACDGCEQVSFAKINIRKNPNLNSFFQSHRIEQRDPASAAIIREEACVRIPVSSLVSFSDPDWIAIDTEGMDQAIMQSIILLNKRPKYISFEHHFISEASMDLIHDSMKKNGFKLGFKSHSDALYIFQKNP